MRNFEFDKDAALNAVLYIVSKLPDPTFHSVSKVMYFADRYHLERYGRLICGDTYIAMKHGPVPSVIYDLLKAVKNGGSLTLNAELVQMFLAALEVKGNFYIVEKAQANLDYLSESDIEALDYSIKQYGSLTFSELTKQSHDDAYESTGFNDVIDIETIVRTFEDSELLLEHLRDPHPG
jgi:uncharacterized phage-associated protein